MTGAPELPGFRLGPWIIDAMRQVATSPEREVPLSANEFGLLQYLFDRRRDGPVDRAELLQEVYGYAPGVRSRAVDLGVNRLRKKIEADPSNPRLLVARRGVGLYLEHATDAVPRASGIPVPTGRDKVVGDVDRVLRHPGVVSLVGPAGIGKTHLARYFERRQSCIAVSLLYRADLDGLWGAVADALGTPLSDAADALLSRLSSGEWLILDNFEQMDDDSARAVADWARVGRVLVTSTRALRISDEVVVRVGALEPADALALLQTHARAAGGEPTPDECSRLLARVGGNPLALILTAPALGLLPEGDAGLLDLHSTRPDEEAHHTTLRAAVDWAAKGLSISARQVLGSVAWFRGTFDVVAAEAVSGINGVGAPLSELVRLGFAQRVRGRLSLPPLIALYGRGLADTAARARKDRYLASFHTAVAEKGPAAAKPYLADLEDLVERTADAELWPLIWLGLHCKLRYDIMLPRVERALESRSDARLLGARSLMERILRPERTRSESELADLMAGSHPICLLERAIRVRTTDNPRPLSCEELVASRAHCTFDEWTSALTALAMLCADPVLDLVEATADDAARHGWEYRVVNLRALTARLFLQDGEPHTAYRVLRDQAFQLLEPFGLVDFVAAAWAVGSEEEAVHVARRAVARIAHATPAEQRRGKAVLAAVTWLAGAPAAELARQALCVERGGDGIGADVLSRLVLRLELGGSEAIGHAAIDAALAGGPIPQSGHGVTMLWAAMVTRHRG